MNSSYEKGKNKNTLFFIIDDIARYANKGEVANRIGTSHMKNDNRLFKDHKYTFMNNIQSSLINPSKSKLGLI